MMATRRFPAPLLTAETGRSPRFGINQLSKHPRQNCTVASATGFRLRDVAVANHDSACSLNVTQDFFCCCGLTTLLKYSSVSAALSAMISLARRFRSDFVRLPGPEIGQILARFSA